MLRNCFIISMCVGFLLNSNLTFGQDVQKGADLMKQQQPDSFSVAFNVPSVDGSSISWRSPAITQWLSNGCLDKCDDPNTSGYHFSGNIKNSQKSFSLKVTITTDREYAQPVRYNSETGSFDGKIYFDKNNRMTTPIKLMLRDSNLVIIKTFILTLTE